jgi:hypothetical protein
MTLVGPPRVPWAQLLAIVAVSLIGCASNRGMPGARSGGTWPKRFFWPPPRGSSLWIGKTEQGPRDLAQTGVDLAALLRRQGYLDQRWFPIGVEFVHGFAVSTRLEQLDSGGQVPGSERWISWHPEAVSVFWLSEVTSVRLPRPAQYRAFLVAFTDLPIGPTWVAPRWAPETLMAGPEVPETLNELDLPRGRRLESGRFGVYAYVYEKTSGREEGRLIEADALDQPRGRSPLRLAEAAVP